MNRTFGKFERFLDISKVDEEKQIVYGYASTEALDSQGEIVSLKGLSKSLPEYLKFPTIRNMHKPEPIGTTIQADIEDGKGLFIGAKIVSKEAWELVKEGVLRGFSIGGRIKKMVDNVIEEMELIEISLVDVPANREAVVTVWKADGTPVRLSTEEAEEFKKEFSKAATELFISEIRRGVKKVNVTTKIEKKEGVELKKDVWGASRLVGLACDLSLVIAAGQKEGKDTASLESALVSLKEAATARLAEDGDYSDECCSVFEMADKAVTDFKAKEAETAKAEGAEDKKEEGKETAVETPASTEEKTTSEAAGGEGGEGGETGEPVAATSETGASEDKPAGEGGAEGGEEVSAEDKKEEAAAEEATEPNAEEKHVGAIVAGVTKVFQPQIDELKAKVEEVAAKEAPVVTTEEAAPVKKVEEAAPADGFAKLESVIKDGFAKVDEKITGIETRVGELENKPATSKVVSPAAVAEKGFALDNAEVSEADKAELERINKELAPLLELAKSASTAYTVDKQRRALELNAKKNAILRKYGTPGGMQTAGGFNVTPL